MKKTWLFRWDCTTQFYRDYNNHYTDPYYPTSTMESSFFFVAQIMASSDKKQLRKDTALRDQKSWKGGCCEHYHI